MKASVVIASAVLALGAAISMQFAQADTRQANCEVRKNGETKQGKSGPCSFGQRQGYIDIDLRNGDVYNLRPGNQANHYRDQKGNKVVRTSSSGNMQEFKWEGGTRVIITFSSHGNNGSEHNQGNGSSEYKRGYNDAIKDRPYDQDRHPQDYKDGYRAGEQDRLPVDSAARSPPIGTPTAARRHGAGNMGDYWTGRPEPSTHDVTFLPPVW